MSLNLIVKMFFVFFFSNKTTADLLWQGEISLSAWRKWQLQYASASKQEIFSLTKGDKAFLKNDKVLKKKNIWSDFCYSPSVHIEIESILTETEIDL